MLYKSNQTVGSLFILSSFTSVQFSSVAQSCLTLCNPMNRSTPGLPVHHQLLEFTQTHVHESVMPSSHLILCHSLFLLPPIPPSIRVFSKESTLRMRGPKYCSFSFSIIPSKEHPGLISFSHCRGQHMLTTTFDFVYWVNGSILNVLMLKTGCGEGWVVPSLKWHFPK